MKAFSAVIKPQFEKKGNKFNIRYSESQFNSFQDTLPAFSPDKVSSEEDDNYSYQQVCVATKDRDKVIAKLITDRYSYDTQVALFANRGDGNAVHEQEFNEYQKFRKFAKALATAFIAYLLAL